MVEDQKIIKAVATCSLLLTLSCQGMEQEGVIEAVTDDASLKQAIGYGQLTPTLYTDMTPEQQDSVVAICYRNTDFCFCTGSLVAPHAVLTAAHCFVGYTEDGTQTFYDRQPADVEIRLGQVNSHAATKRRYHVEKIFNYQDENGDYWYNKRFDDESTLTSRDYALDKALVILSEGINHLKPYPLYSEALLSHVGEEAQAVGYGTTELENGKLGSNNRTKYWATMTITAAKTGKTIITASDTYDIGKGDSGSPLLFKDNGVVKVAGILSAGGTHRGNYSPVFGYEDWFSEIINTYDPPACQAACAGGLCGQVAGCLCGGCDRDAFCNSDHHCEKTKPGNGGFCFNDDPAEETISCSSNNDCPFGQFCWENVVSNRCVSSCEPMSCFAGDPNSWCFPTYTPDYRHFINRCVLSAPEPCAPEAEFDSSCHDSINNFDGACYSFDGSTNLFCYPPCDNVGTCQGKEGCFPFDSCSALCTGGCGELNGCKCGECASGLTCYQGRCLEPGNLPENTDEETDEDLPDSSDDDADVDGADNSDNMTDSKIDGEGATTSQNEAVSTESAASRKGCNAGGESVPAVIMAMALFAIWRKKTYLEKN